MKTHSRPLCASVAALLLSGCFLPARSAAQEPPPATSPVLSAYQSLRGLKLSGEFASVDNMTFKRDAATFTLKRGELYFVTPVEGRITAAVFLGDGEFSLTPPLECEKKSLAIYTRTPAITEPFAELVLRFSDETWEEARESGKATFGQNGPQQARAAKILEDNDTLLRERLRENYALRTFTDIYSKEKQRRGYFTAFIKGAKFPKLVYAVDPRGRPEVAPEQVLLGSYNDSDAGIWAAFPMTDPETGRPVHDDARSYDITKHDITATIDGTKMQARDTISLRVQREGANVLAFDLFPLLRVSKVTDASGASLPFVQQPKNEDAQLAVVLPQAPPVNAEYTLTIEYQGDGAIRDMGGGNFMLLPRSTWYPNNGSTAFGDRALFRTTYRLPKNLILVGTGTLAEPEKLEGETTVATWTSGDVELAVTGFNIGRFKKKELMDKESGYNIEFFGNKELPAEMKQMQYEIEQLEQQGVRTNTTLGAMSTTAMADAAISDAQNATRIYNIYFGKLPYSRIAMTQQPAQSFGQAWPTLIYMPYTAFLDSTIRTQLYGIKGGTNTFWQYVGPHEVAHQWWGHIIGWTSYRDQWMSEGFAEFSASLYVQHVRGMDKFVQFWEAHRKEITSGGPATDGKPPYTIGPVTQGYRLSGAKTGAVYQLLVYPKGAYILHMLRMMMYTPQEQDNRFSAMMKDFVQSYNNKDVSTEDFKRIVDKHVTPEMNLDGNGRLDWFFNQWIYGTEMPSYAFEYSFKDEGGKPVLYAKLTQSGVSDNFKMLVPVYLDFGKGWSRLGQVRLTGNASQDFKVPLPQKPKRAAVNALNDVLCLNVTNVRK